MSKTNKKNYFAPSTLGLGAMRRASMMLLVMMLSVLTAWADSYPAYITDVMVIGGDASTVDSKWATYQSQGYKKVDFDLNSGASGDYVYVLYKTGSRNSTDGGYVTDLVVSTTDASSVTYNGTTYTRVAHDGSDHFKKYGGNLNSSAKSGSTNMWLFYTKKNFSDKRAVNDIVVNTSSSKSGYTTIGKNGGSDAYDLNDGAGGDYVYMHFSTTAKTNRPASDPTMKTGLVYTGQPLQLVNYNPTSQCTMYYRVGTSGSYTSTVSDITATNAGTHTVYYYATTNSYGDYGPTFSQTVTISKAANSGVTVSCDDVMEGNAPQPTLGGTNLSTGAVTYKYSTSQSGSYTTTVPTTAGTYWVKATIASDANCNEYTTAAASFKMTPDWALHNSGDSEADAYVINTTADLDLLAQRVNAGNNYSGKYFRLGADITYDGTENNYNRIGLQDKPFSGHFDGKGHTISSININKTGVLYLGLFGHIDSGASVKNIRLSNVIIVGKSYCGGIAGMNSGGVVENCSVASDVRISANNTYSVRIGGIVGHNNGTVSGCKSSATINAYEYGNQYLGGIVGRNDGTLRNNVVAGAQITGYYKFSGIICYNYGTLTCNYYLDSSGSDTNGARRGVRINAADGVTITPTGTATTYNVSGITAYEDNNAILYNGQLYAGATGQVRLNISYAMPADYQLKRYTDGQGHALTANGNGTYTLTMTAEAATVTPEGTSLWGIADGADGSQQHPYVITTTAGLDLLAQRVNNGTNYSGKYFELGADITYDGTENNFTPIGTNVYDNQFRGIFDGKGHVINGINVNLPNNDFVGLFGNLRSATIKNVTLTNSNITGRDWIGGIVGNCEPAVIENCHTTNTVTINANNKGGGIAGFVGNTGSYSQIKGCTSAAAVNGIDSDYSLVGGLVGLIRKSNTVQDCLYLGNTVNGRQFGAIAGTDIGTFTNTYHTVYGMGAVNGRDRKEDDFIATYAITSDTKPDGFGDATVTYGTGSYAGITAYGTNGLEYMGVYYRYGENIVALEDNKNNECVIDAHSFSSTCTVTLKDRTLLKNGDWNTLCLPFGLSAEQIAASPLAGATIKELDGTTSNLDNNGKLTLNFSPVTEIEAGKPYIVKWTTTGENISNPVFSDVKIDGSTPTEVNFSGGKFVGNYAPFTIDDGNKDYVLFFSTGNKIGYSKTTPRTLKCMRAHLEMTNPNAARSIELDFGEGKTTGIDGLNGELKNGKIEELKFYDLNGRRVENPTKGIYIVNGKKVVIK